MSIATDTRTEPAQDVKRLDTALLVLRIALGIVFMAHGAQLLFGAWGGPGLKGVMAPPAEHGMGPVGLLVAIGQFFGGLGILVGFLTRFSAGALAVIMLGAIFMVHIKNGFFIQAQGFEYAFTLLGMALCLLLAGPGRYAVQNSLPGALRKL